MPATKKYPSEEKRARSQACIDRYMRLNGIEINQLAKRMNVTDKTIYRWKDNPEKMQLEDLWALSTILKCPIGEICGGELPEELIGRFISLAMKAV